MVGNSDNASKQAHLSTDRVTTLTDGIFAIAMTLLVLSIDVPESSTVASGTALHRYLIHLYPQFFNYFLSFYLLSRLWVNLHRMFHVIIRTDHPHIWINIVLLMFVCLVPFSASLDAEYSSDPLAATIFHTNMLILALLFSGNWIYAARHHRLVREDIPEAMIRWTTIKTFIFPAAAVTALVITPFSPSYSPLCYFLIPFAIKILRGRILKQPPHAS